MTTIGYVFLDVTRDALVPLMQQRQVIEEYAGGLGLSCDELLVEQSYSSTVPLLERDEGKRLLNNVQEGDTILVMKAEWVLGSPKAALGLLDILKRKGVALFCLDLDGNISRQTERKLIVSEGIAPLVYKLCQALSLGESGDHGAAIRAAKALKKKEGKYMGGPIPFGWIVNEEGRLQKDSEQQELIVEMIRLKEDRWSYRDIARKFHEKYDLKLSHEGIRRILLKTQKKKKK
ncbi:MAG: recombinase family protein [Proteobacteria bacterium]|nr:recombinase family protein [Pseudomonadota bacterium]MBU1234195.1 recombinase family protein [Pseudomonadota bacterium]MBU1417440.1 recombinase family protein [Pseudomonadota bacterium]MBU1455653.1 recombinase family protein [Pseudomonadota bacterium]